MFQRKIIISHFPCHFVFARLFKSSRNSFFEKNKKKYYKNKLERVFKLK